MLVAFSGGGKRSASFGYGALRGMRDLMVPTPVGPRSLLSQVDAMSGVSGGSFPAAYYGLYRDKMFGRFETDFLYSDTNSYIYGVYLLPWNWSWLVEPGIGTNDFMDRVYDQTMFHGATFADLQARGRPTDRDRRDRHLVRHPAPVQPGNVRPDLLGPVLDADLARGRGVERVSGPVLAGHADQSREGLRRPAAGLAAPGRS